MENKSKNINSKTKIICAVALALLVGVFGVIALLSIIPFNTSASSDLPPLHAVNIANTTELENLWNDAVAHNETNTKLTLTGNIDAPTTGILGNGIGFKQSGSIYVPAGFNLEIDLNGYRLNKGELIMENGAVIINDGTLTISDTGTNPQTHDFQIKGVTYSITGGAIMGGFTMNNGGAILNHGTLNFVSGQIANCSAEGSGGGIAATTNSTTNITGGSFSYNFANINEGTNGGGAIALLGTATLNLSNAVFRHNQSNALGGAIFADYNSTLNITDLNLADNKAQYGAGLATGGIGTIATAAVANNDANLAGGGIYVFGGKLTVNEGAFENNTTQQATASTDYVGGGAIFIDRGTLNLNGTRNNTTSNITFLGNTARFGGAIANSGGKINATGLVVRDNNAKHPTLTAVGGGVANLGGTSTYADCYFAPSNAKTAGRSLYVNYGTLNIDGGLIENHNNSNGGSMAALGQKIKNDYSGTLNFTGDVVLQYNTNLVNCWSVYDDQTTTFGGTVNFDGATVQYCGYGSAAEYENKSGTTVSSIIGDGYHGLFRANFYRLNAHHNRASNGFAMPMRDWTIGTADGQNEDVVFTNNNCDFIAGIGAYGHIYHGTFENNTTHNGLFSWMAFCGPYNLTIDDGIFRNNTAENHGAVVSSISSNQDNTGLASVDINGGLYEGNTGVTAGVFAISDRILINGGTFKNNCGNAGVVSMHYHRANRPELDRNLTITGGTFTGNTANGQGGVAYVSDSRIRAAITGGTFTGNQAYVATANRSATDGGAIYTKGKTTLSGNPIIKDNTAGTNKVRSNLYTEKLLTIDGQLSGDNRSIYIANRGQFTEKYSVSNSALPRNIFVSDYDNYNIERLDGEAIAVPTGASSSNYAMEPTVVATTPAYNGQAQNIIAGYVSQKMEVVSIKHTWFDETSYSTLSSDEETFTDVALARFINAATGSIIATDAGRYTVTFRPKAGYEWLKSDGSTNTDTLVITADINKYYAPLHFSRNVFNYTGELVATSTDQLKPAIYDNEKIWLKDWKVPSREDNMPYGLRWLKDATTLQYGEPSHTGIPITITPVYQTGMGRNYYTQDVAGIVNIRVVDIANDKFFEVRVDDVKYTGKEVKPSFSIYYRDAYLGQWTGTEWVENADRPHGPFKIKNVTYYNNVNPSSTDNQPMLSFAVDTSYEQSSTYKVMNFTGNKMYSFTINGYDISKDEGDGSMTGTKIVGTPKVTTSKTYDGNRTVAVEWRGLVSIEGANGTLSLADIVATYDNANVGENKTITVRYVFSGSNAWLYSYSYQIEDGVITPLTINRIDGLTANKVYDGTTDATLITGGATYAGKLVGDELNVAFKDGTALTYAVADVGTNKTMNYNLADLELTGAQAGNYQLAEDFVANITGTVTAANFVLVTANAYTGTYDGVAHDMIINNRENPDDPDSIKAVLCDGATQADEDSLQWQYSLDEVVWEDEIPQMTRAANIPVYYRVSANNHNTFSGQVQFALSPIDINDTDAVEINISLGQTEVVYDGVEHPIVPMITATLKANGKTLNLRVDEDFRIDYVNSYTEGEYDNGKGDTKNVGTITLSIIGSGSSFINVLNEKPQFAIVPQTVALPAVDTTNFHYNGGEQTYYITPDERYTLAGNVQTEIGEHDVQISLVDKHNYVWANGSTDDLIHKFTIYGADVQVNWSWLQDYYYVGNTYTVDQALSGIGSNKADGTPVAGVVSFLTTDGLLTITDPDNEHFATPNQAFDVYVEAKFTPTDTNYAPVTATLKVPAKWILITYNSNIGAGSANAYSTYMYDDTVIYLDKITGESKLSRPYYTQVGWTLNPDMAPLSARGMTETAFNRKLDELGVVALNGETFATADATYYAVWCYLDYKINFHTNNPQQYKTLSGDVPTLVEMFWTDESVNLFTENYNGQITYDESNRVYVYTFNHGEWTNKKQSMLLNSSINWAPGNGFVFTHWADGDGNRINGINTLGNLDLYAQWQGAKYAVHFVDRDTTLVDVGEVTNGQVLSDQQVPTISRTGYNFSGWFIVKEAADDADNNGEQRVILDETVIWTTEDITLYAGWTEKKVVLDIAKVAGLTITVEAVEDGNTRVVNSGEFLSVGSTLNITVTPKAGYTFTRLFLTVEGKQILSDNESTVEYQIEDYQSTSNRIPLTITGVCDTVNYTITYNHDQNSGVWEFVEDYDAPNNYTVEKQVVLPTADEVNRSGYTLVGWFLTADLQGTMIRSTKDLTADNLTNLTVYPKWDANTQNIVLYKGGKAYSNIQQVTDSTYTLLDLSAEAGFEDYTFQGWSTQADLSGGIMPAGSTYTVQPSNNNLYAVWAFKTGDLTISADKTGDWYNFGAPVITITPKYNFTYNNTRNGIKLTYTYYNQANELVPSENGILKISEVSQSGNYICKVTISDNGYALPETIASEPITVAIWQKSIDTNGLVFANMPNQVYTGEALTPTLPTITLNGFELVPDVDFTYSYSRNTDANAWAHLTIVGVGNYTGTVDKAVFYIDPAAMTANATAYTGVYDGVNHVGITSKEASMADAIWTYSIYGEGNTYYAEIPEYKNAGEYTLYYRVERPNYTTVNGQVTVVIDAKEIVVTWGTTSFTYDASEKHPEATAVTGIASETVTLTVQGAAVNAGTHLATAITTDTNYALINATTNYTIAPKTISVTIITPDKIQRVGDEIEYADAILNGVEASDTVKWVATYSDRETGEIVDGKPTAAGNYLVTITIDNGNYQLTGLNNAPFVILGKDETIQNYITIQLADWTYGNQPSDLVFKSAAPLRADHAEDEPTIIYYRWNGEGWTEMTETFTEQTAVGRYKVFISISAVDWSDTDKYGRTYADKEHEFNVLPRELVLTWNNLSHTYDGNKHEPTVTPSNFANGDEFTLSVVTADNDGINAGKYVATVAAPTNDNYKLPEVATQEYVINKAALTIKIDDKEQIYQAPAEELTVETIAGTVYVNDNADGSVYTISRDEGDNVGDYRIIGTSTNPNYSVTFLSTDDGRAYGWYKIMPQPVVVVWSTEYTYNGFEQTPVAKIIDNYSGVEINLAVAAYQNEKIAIFKNAGDYTLQATDTTGNYSLQNSVEQVAIDTAKLLIQPNDLSVRYAENIVLTATITGFVGDDDETVLKGGRLTTTYKVNDNIIGEGNYPIEASGYNNPNYEIIYGEPGMLHVEGISITVLVKNQTSMYGDSILEPEYVFLDETLMNPGAVFALQKDAGDSVGEYPINSRILNRNYSIKFVTESGEEGTATYTITPRKITVKIADVSNVYGTAEKKLRAEVASDAIIGDDNANGSVYTLVREVGNKVGEYKITGISRNENYIVSFTAVNNERDYGIYYITPRQIVAPDRDMTIYEYNGQEQTYQITGWMDRDFYTLSGNALNSFGEPTQVNAGTYQLILTLDPNCAWIGVPKGQEYSPLTYEFTIRKTAFKEHVAFNPYQEQTYDGREHNALTIESPLDTQFVWQYSVDGGETYSETMPRFSKAGRYTVYFKITSQNYDDYDGFFNVTINKAKIKVIVGENTVVQNKGGALNNFEVIGLQGEDKPTDVIELFAETYDPENAAVGDVFELSAKLREEYQDCYEIETIETNTLTVVEEELNLIPIIAAIGGGVITLAGGGTTAAITITRRKKGIVAAK